MPADARELRWPAPSDLPLVGRAREQAALQEVLRSAAAGSGACWVLEGPGGVGKSRLARWLEDEAERAGFAVRWGDCFEDALAPFFPWAQVLRRSGPVPTRRDASGGPLGGHDVEGADRSSVKVFEDPGPPGTSIRAEVARLSEKSPTLLLTRDRPSLVREKWPTIAPSATLLWLSRVEDEGSVLPGRLDELGERLEKHLRSQRGSVVALEGLEYLSSQAGFPPVLSLLEYLRDVAQATRGQLLVSYRPAAFERKETALLSTLEEDGRANTPPRRALAPPALDLRPDEPPALVWLRLLEVIESESVAGPLLVVLDDLQWADPASVRALQFLARNTRERPVLYLATLRTDAPSAPDAGTGAGTVVEEVLANMEREGILRRWGLEGLSDAGLQELVEECLGAKLDPEGPAKELLARTAGNPYFLLASLQMLVEEGRVDLDDGRARLQVGPGGDLGVPATLRRAVEARLARLSSGERELLEAASVVGLRFDLPPILFALGREERSVVTDLERLGTSRGLVGRVRGLPGRWEFDHPLSWSIVRANAPPETYRRRAGEIADWWAKHRPDEEESIARLYHVALRADPGVRWVHVAFDHARREHRAETLERLHHWLQDLLVAGGAEPGARAEEGCRVLRDFLDEMGPGSPVAERLAEAVVGLAEEGLPRRRAELLRLRVLATRRPDRAQEEISRIEGVLRTDPAWVPEDCRGTWAAARVKLLTDHLHREAEAVALIDAALPTLLEGREDAERDYLRLVRVWCLSELGRLDEAEEALSALNGQRPGGPPSRDDGRRLGTAARLATLRDRYRESGEVYLRSAAIFRELGDISNLSTSLYNAASAAAMAGELSTTTRVLDELRELCDKFDLQVKGATARLLGAEVHGRRTGDWGEVPAMVEEARRRATRAGYSALTPYCDLLSASALVRAGRAAEAEGLLQKERGVPDKGGSRELLTAGRVLRALVDEARGAPPEAHAELKELLAHEEGATGTRLGRARALALLARWEERHGDPDRWRELDRESSRLFDECQISEEGRRFYGWWPPVPPDRSVLP